MFSNTLIIPTHTSQVLVSPPKATFREVITAPKPTLGQRLGFKKAVGPAINVTEIKSTLAVPTHGVAAFNIGCDLLPLDVAQQRYDISHRVFEDERNGRPCGSYSIGCDLLPLDVARGRREISHRAIYL
ncbi:hypothetical protein WOLCODRAFT_157401 [Wolfiporia cocos MD-104 SS10]|uniref:Uncharacterized protein n=1 Tax=Wolfiporia cocos (strain MD-104) TaxID=742152 RepID=A0A2H3JJ44_WOLCO|nr:hypothetical protein WOLCODRAFT_157401 [Wolfiporia cocos MD-104 SS10]